MTSEQRPSVYADAPSPSDDGWQAEGFGLVLRSLYPVVGLKMREGGGGQGDATRLLLDGRPASSPPPEGKRLREVRYRDGRVAMAIDDHGSVGLRIVAEEFGAHQISRDGSTIRSRPVAGLPAWRWQRLLTGQVLPLAAALRGLEVIHASAVAVDGIAFALAGDSGMGKSMLAAHLALRGNALLADDVLAVSIGGSGQAQAHPGSAALSVRREDSSPASRLVQAGLATAIGSDDKQHVLVSATARELPLGAVYLLGRGIAGGTPIGEPRSPTLAELMSCSYVRYLGTQPRLTAQLSVQAAIARNCSIVPVNVSSGLTPEGLGAELEAHMTRIAGGHSQS